MIQMEDELRIQGWGMGDTGQGRCETRLRERCGQVRRRRGKKPNMGGAAPRGEEGGSGEVVGTRWIGGGRYRRGRRWMGGGWRGPGKKVDRWRAALVRQKGDRGKGNRGRWRWGAPEEEEAGRGWWEEIVGCGGEWWC